MFALLIVLQSLQETELLTVRKNMTAFFCSGNAIYIVWQSKLLCVDWKTSLLR